MHADAAFCIETLFIVAFKAEYRGEADIVQILLCTFDVLVAVGLPCASIRVPVAAQVRTVRLEPALAPVGSDAGAYHLGLRAGGEFAVDRVDQLVVGREGGMAGQQGSA